MICTDNHGQLILSSSYWGSEYDRGGNIFCSVNAGSVRVLVPQSNRELIEEFRACKYVVLSRGPWPAMRLPEAAELLLEDGTASPYAMQLSPESFDALPGEPEPGREWMVSAWVLKKGKPHKAVERVCHWRCVPSLPCLRPWEAAP